MRQSKSIGYELIILDDVGTGCSLVCWAWACGHFVKQWEGRWVWLRQGNSIQDSVSGFFWLVFRFWCSAMDTFLGTLHMAFGSSRTWVQVFCYQRFAGIWALFEEILLQHFHQGGDFWGAQRLEGKLNCIGTVSDWMGEHGHVNRGWIFLINKIFSQHAALRWHDGSWSDGEGPKVGGEVLNAMQNNLTLVFNFTRSVSKITLQPTLHRTRMPMREAMDNPRTICPMKIIGSPRRQCCTCALSAWCLCLVGWWREQVRCQGDVTHGDPAITNMDVPLMLAMEWLFANTIALGKPRQSADAILYSLDLFDATTVGSLSVLLIVLRSKAYNKISFS